MVTHAIKIGLAKDCGKRLKQHQCGSPTQLCLEKSWAIRPEDASQIEARVHRLCKSWHMHGEWFRPEAAQTVYAVMPDLCLDQFPTARPVRLPKASRTQV